MKNKTFNFVFCGVLLLFAIMLWGAAFMYKGNLVAANDNIAETQLQTTATTAATILKQDGMQQETGELTFKSMTTSDREKFVYSDDNYDININVNSKPTFTGEININQSKVDISAEYEKCNSMLNIELAFADVNSDSREDVIMKMKAYDAMTLAVFVATDSGYTKLSEPSDIPAITINVLEQGMLEVNCAELQLNCQMVMSELCKMQLAADGTEVYDKSCNLLKSLQINAEEQTNDVYNYSFNNIDGEFVIGVEKVVNYISVPTGVGYTQLYKVEGENLKLVDTKIYNTDAGYR